MSHTTQYNDDYDIRSKDIKGCFVSFLRTVLTCQNARPEFGWESGEHKDFFVTKARSVLGFVDAQAHSL